MTWLLGNVPKGNLLLTLLKTPAWLEGHWSRHTPLSSWGRSLTFLMQTNWFMRRLECLKKLRNVISGTLRAATSLADMSSGYEATNLCVQKNLLSAREKWTPGNVQCSRTCQLCFALFFFYVISPQSDSLTVAWGRSWNLPLANAQASPLLSSRARRPLKVYELQSCPRWCDSPCTTTWVKRIMWPLETLLLFFI